MVMRVEPGEGTRKAKKKDDLYWKEIIRELHLSLFFFCFSFCFCFVLFVFFFS